jgi:tetratricopeptide (TPR) repeat protein
MNPPGELAFAAIEARVQTAEDAFRRGDYAGALDQYRRLLTDRLTGGKGTARDLRAADLVVIERLADLSALFGLFDAADDLLRAMVDLTRSAQNDLAADYTQMKRVELSLLRGQLRGAFDQLRELESRIGDITEIDMSPGGFVRWENSVAWRDVPAADREVLFSRTFFVFARILAANGQFRQSILSVDRGLTHAGAHAADLAQMARVPMRLVRASVLFEAGDLEDADAELRALDRVIDAAQSPGWRVRWLELSGHLGFVRGEFSLAVARFDEVLRICAGGGFHHPAIAAHLNVAHVLILLNRIRDATGHLDEAEHYASGVDDWSALQRVDFLRSIADARRRSLADTVSIELSVTEMVRGAARNIGIAPRSAGAKPADTAQSPGFLTLFEDRALQVQRCLAEGDLKEAVSRVAALESVFGTSESRLIVTRLGVLLGMVAYYAGRTEEAMRLLAAAAEGLADMRLKPELWQVLRVQGWCASRLGRKGDEQQLVERATGLLEQIAGSLGGAERAIFLLNKWTADEEYLAHEINRLVVGKTAFVRAGLLRRPFAWLSMARRLNRLMAHVDRHKTILVQNSLGTGVGSGRRPHVPSLLRRLLATKRDRITLSFLVLPDRVLVTRCGFLHLGFAVAAITRVEVRDQIRQWHEMMQGTGELRDLGDLPVRGPPPRDGWDRVASVLADALQLPDILAALPARVSALTIVPDDSLHGFPFAAISCNGQPLIERYALSIGFDTAASRPPAPRTKAHALLVAVSRGTARIPPLPQTVDEVRTVESWCGERGIATSTLVDERATKECVAAALCDASMFHIACHGTFLPDRPDASGMVLIPGVEQVEILSLRDLSGVSLSNCHHATLSSCWSADNFILPGRWIVSLPETLYRAGARSILACLWPVDDRVATAFMAAFYERLGTCTRAEALRRTQLACRSGRLPGCADIDTSAPFYWAGFNLYGEPGPFLL